VNGILKGSVETFRDYEGEMNDRWKLQGEITGGEGARSFRTCKKKNKAPEKSQYWTDIDGSAKLKAFTDERGPQRCDLGSSDGRRRYSKKRG